MQQTLDLLDTVSVFDDQSLELGMQELEAMEAPGFWTGVAIGVGIVGVAVASAALYSAISVLT
ncbi:daptide-type RiPP [Streptacidiphilus sp. N1-12]|uniref:Daptide-type RiPP n=2 Tax=Streptacidiphilus alkalitolerans TaxID=3342712 RepID=A0ABV6V3S7_9ACTN